MILGFLIVSSTLAASISVGQALAANSSTFPVNSSPYGVSFKDWTAKWDKWMSELPKSLNWNFKNVPGVKYVPKDCSFNQTASSPVFFLPWVDSSRGSSASQTCTVPHNKAILVSVTSITSDYSDPSIVTKTPKELIKAASQLNTYPRDFSPTLDGKPLDLKNDAAHKVTSDLFNLTLPKDNLWSDREPPGPDKAIIQGWWIMLKPLPPGEHTLQYTTGYKSYKTDNDMLPGQGNPTPYIQDVTYRLIVK
jgi:hypothetical protein